MAKIIARGYPTHVGTWKEGPLEDEVVVSQFQLWCRTDDEKTYVRYVDITWSGSWETLPPSQSGWPAEVLDTLYRSQLDFERQPDVYGPPVTSPEELGQIEMGNASPQPSIVQGFKEREDKEWQDVADWASDFNLPSDPNDPDREHIGGPAKCWCGRTHPPHKKWEPDCDKAPLCWCRKKHCGMGFYRGR